MSGKRIYVYSRPLYIPRSEITRFVVSRRRCSHPEGDANARDLRCCLLSAEERVPHASFRIDFHHFFSFSCSLSSFSSSYHGTTIYRFRRVVSTCTHGCRSRGSKFHTYVFHLFTPVKNLLFQIFSAKLWVELNSLIQTGRSASRLGRSRTKRPWNMNVSVVV
jgi:hypothetical protein